MYLFRLKKKEDRRRQQYHLASNGEECPGTFTRSCSHNIK